LDKEEKYNLLWSGLLHKPGGVGAVDDVPEIIF